MDKETIKQIQEKIDKALLAQGIDPTIGDFNRKLKAELEQQAREKLAEEIKRQVAESIEEMVSEKLSEIQSSNENFKNQVVEAIKEVTIDNQVDVNVPDVIVPKIEMPEINVPQPKVTVNVPEIKAPKVEMPKEIEVKGFVGFVKAIFEILKNQITVKLGGIDRDKPLPVILVDEKGIYYKAISNMIANGGGGSIKGLMNVAGTIINPATEDKQDDIITELGDIIAELQDIETLITSDTSGLTVHLATEVTLTTAGTAYLLPSTEQAGRRLIEVYNKSDANVYLGGAGVTTTTGMLVEPGDKYFKDATSGVYAVADADATKINVVESK